MDNKTVTIIAVAAFVIGSLLGSGISGKKNVPKADAKELLTQAIQQIDGMEQEKNSLIADLKQVNKSKLANEKKVLQETLGKARQDNKQLHDKISSLSGQLAQSELRLEEKEDLRPEIASRDARIAELEKANQDLKVVLEQISSLTVPPGAVISEQPAAEEKTKPTQTEQGKDTVNQ